MVYPPCCQPRKAIHAIRIRMGNKLPILQDGVGAEERVYRILGCPGRKIGPGWCRGLRGHLQSGKRIFSTPQARAQSH
jgi:hypothetical protein